MNVSQNKIPHGCPFRMKAKLRAMAYEVTRGQATLPLRPRPTQRSAFISPLWRPFILSPLTLNPLSPDTPLHTESRPPLSVRLASTHPWAQISLVRENSLGGSLKRLSCWQFDIGSYDGLRNTEILRPITADVWVCFPSLFALIMKGRLEQ